ncbi:UNVERIFIED_ORG: non-homologous end joining protein Ku [Rhizobium sp. SORGH_AS 755]|nr:non-homologous end joining protein Ku [Rhizobium sp. SORGH_AS_0755]
MLDIIAAKKKALKKSAKPRTSTPAKSAPSNVINIMDALKKSVAAENRAGK